MFERATIRVSYNTKDFEPKNGYERLAEKVKELVVSELVPRNQPQRDVSVQIDAIRPNTTEEN